MVSRLRVVHAALVRIFLCMVQPFGATALGRLGQDQRRKRQDQNKQCRDSPEFHLLFPSDDAALNAELFRARAGNARAKVEHFHCHLMKSVSESWTAGSNPVLNLRWQTSC